MVDWMDIFIYIVMLLLIITKFLDVLSTIKRITHPSIETNPFAKRLMVRFGIRSTAWGVFGLVVLITLIAGRIALDGQQDLEFLFIGLGIFLSIVQFSVAHNNWTRKPNLITKWVWKYHNGIQSILSKRS